MHAEYVAEMVRQAIAEHYPEEVYTRGFRVYTTIRKADQEAAYAALRRGVLEYDRSHGYRGAEGYAELPATPDEDDFDEALADHPDNDDLLAAVVLSAKPRRGRSRAAHRREGHAERRGAELRRPRRSTRRPRRSGASAAARSSACSARARTGRSRSCPRSKPAFISLDPQDGAIRALVGGFDFSRNKFNHVTQAWRQPGSSFKPFIYSASLEKGFTAATVIADEPVVLEAEQTGSQRWEPKNYDGKYEGPMRMRTALAKSKNMVSIRILDAIGPKYAQDYVTRFGFEPEKHPPYLTMALGAGSVTAWQMARAYSVFANGGFLIQPYFILKIVDDRGNPLALANPPRAGEESLRVIDPRNAFIMDSMMQDVTRIGTAARAARLGRSDLAGKTGTTNEFVDAWFAGYQPNLVGIVVGRLRPAEDASARTRPAAWSPCRSGSATWKRSLKDMPETPRSVPDGVVTVPMQRARARRRTPRAAHRSRSWCPNSSTRRRCRRPRCCGRCRSAGAGRCPPPAAAAGRPRPPGLGRERTGCPALRRGERDSAANSSRAVARVAPGRAVPAEMEAARARRHPDLARRAVAVDDDLRAVGELDLEHAALLQLEIGVDAARLERALDALQRCAGQALRIRVVHGC